MALLYYQLVQALLQTRNLIDSDNDPYTYTAGRWLHQDEVQRHSRLLQFDFPRLCEIAVRLCDGASKVTGYEKKEGGYNRVFILTLYMGKRAVAKAPTPKLDQHG
ncbi:hypothetical protein AJ79_08037 [Helicocarpus griseus UAMH5409]|uniref:Uncharacterized protein n=1 Tax=Helicocarpus griseus UAMH5409 TaxID=1447875 RepID=A0A2B7WWX6_9EURO|nr:hypothetical protein AJ79_08037 [Helicocarpus griseus UAMH5409]